MLEQTAPAFGGDQVHPQTNRYHRSAPMLSCKDCVALSWSIVVWLPLHKLFAVAIQMPGDCSAGKPEPIAHLYPPMSPRTACPARTHCALCQTLSPQKYRRSMPIHSLTPASIRQNR